MPSQLYKNSAVYFICARNFLWAGTEYAMGEEFDQDIAPGRLDLLVRTRRIIPVVDDPADKPRHWHHHIWPRALIDEKLGVAVGSSTFTRQPQVGVEFDSVETDSDFIDQDKGAELLAMAKAAASPEPVEEPVEDVFDVSDHTVEQVMDFIEAHPDQVEAVIAQEEAGKNRSTLLSQLHDLLEE